MRALDRLLVPPALRRRWVTAPEGADEVFHHRLVRDRTEIVPWLASLERLDGSRVLEIGSGRGASTFALSEQGADVTAVDVNAQAMAYAETQLSSAGLRASFNLLNATELQELPGEEFDLVIFWASLEHMTVPERLTALRAGWDHLRPGATLVIIETPNRLWPDDSHTSELPFFNWLPDELAFAYLPHSTRGTLSTTFTDPSTQMLQFQRLGRGVSYHEIELALGEAGSPTSCMQIDRRRRNPIRRLAWAGSTAGAVERTLRRFAPSRSRAWFQPFLYLGFRKDGSHPTGPPTDPRRCP